MPLDYNNPNDWGKSPLTDRALQIQRCLRRAMLTQAEKAEEWVVMINGEEEESEKYPPFTGREFLAEHSTIDDHPYATAFGQFLGNGIDPDVANILAFGENRFDLISEDSNNPLRQRATRIFVRFEGMGYWNK